MQLPAITVGLVHAQRSCPMPPEGVWRGPYRWKTWVIDWRDHAGQQMRIDDEEPHHRPARSWYLYAPGTSYRELEMPSAGGRRRDQSWFFFTLAKPWPLLTGRSIAVAVDNDELLTPHLDAMHVLQARGEPGHELALHGHALAVLGEILVASQHGGGMPHDPWRIRAERTSDPSLLDQVDRETLRDLRHPPALDELAERLGLSTSGLCHRFKAETGMTVMLRQRWLRVREARRLLGRPEATVKEVAWRLGYSSPFHLSQQFHAIAGMTAADFLRRQR